MRTYIPLKVVVGDHRLLREEALAGLRFLLNLVRESSTDHMASLNPDELLTFAEAFCLWVYSTLVGRERLTKNAMLLLLQLYGPHFLDLGDRLDVCMQATGEAPLWQNPDIMYVADGRYVRLPWMPDGAFFDVRDGQTVTKIPPTFEGISYNLSHLAAREWVRAQEAQDGAHQTPEVAPAES